MERINPLIAAEHARTLSEMNSAELRKWIRKELSTLAIMTKETVTAEVLNGYVNLLADQPRHKLRKAFRQAALTLKFFPKPAELIELCNEQEPEAEQQTERRYLCDPNCECKGAGFIYGPDKITEWGTKVPQVHRCPRRMKRASQSA